MIALTRRRVFENWNRYYDPSIGRYLQPEPLLAEPVYVKHMALKGHSLPAYAYALNNPIGFIDPNGLGPTGCTNTYDCCIQRHPGNPEACGGPPPSPQPPKPKEPPKVPPYLPPPGTGKEPQECKEPEKKPEPDDDSWRDQCITLYVQCKQRGWGSAQGWNCHECLRNCQGQKEWPFHLCGPSIR